VASLGDLRPGADREAPYVAAAITLLTPGPAPPLRREEGNGVFVRSKLWNRRGPEMTVRTYQHVYDAHKNQGHQRQGTHTYRPQGWVFFSQSKFPPPPNRICVSSIFIGAVTSGC